MYYSLSLFDPVLGIHIFALRFLIIVDLRVLMKEAAQTCVTDTSSISDDVIFELRTSQACAEAEGPGKARTPKMCSV